MINNIKDIKDKLRLWARFSVAITLLISFQSSTVNAESLSSKIERAKSEFAKAKKSLSSGLKVTSLRSRVVAENMANSKSTGVTPGSDPYTRKMVKVQTRKDRKTGARVVAIDGIIKDKTTPFKKKYEPSHPAADKDGYVKYPNVNNIYENVDLLEAQKDHRNLLGAYKQITNLERMTINNIK